MSFTEDKVRRTITIMLYVWLCAIAAAMFSGFYLLSLWAHSSEEVIDVYALGAIVFSVGDFIAVMFAAFAISKQDLSDLAYSLRLLRMSHSKRINSHKQ